MNNEQYARAGHNPEQSAHSWGKPLPGHGSVDVCRRCGAKRNSKSEREACASAASAAEPIPEVHEYDPI